MKEQHIQRIIADQAFPEECPSPTLIETHISWIILCKAYAFKIKKPVKFSFLDFSSFAKRTYFCRRELLLNSRLAPDLYVKVVPVMKQGNKFRIAHGDKNGPGEVVDHALMMKRMASERQMDVMLSNNRVNWPQVEQLAEVLATFHRDTRVVQAQPDTKELKQTFNDISQVLPYLQKERGTNRVQAIINRAVKASDDFIDRNKDLFKQRQREGFVRDGHGDLHTGNVFLYDDPVVFDCIEFNDAFRQLDVLNDIGFLCMDLDAQERQDLTDIFLQKYLMIFPCLRNEAENQLLTYYKLYRANVRTKVLVLKAMETNNYDAANDYLQQAMKYIDLMEGYISQLKVGSMVKS